MDKFTLFKKAKENPRRGKFSHVRPKDWTDTRMGEWHKNQADKLGEEHKNYKYHMSSYKKLMKKEGVDTDMRWSKKFFFNLFKAKGEGSRGGKVVGHTKSGKAIYESHSAGFLSHFHGHKASGRESMWEYKKKEHDGHDYKELVEHHVSHGHLTQNAKGSVSLNKDIAKKLKGVGYQDSAKIPVLTKHIQENTPKEKVKVPEKGSLPKNITQTNMTFNEYTDNKVQIAKYTEIMEGVRMGAIKQSPKTTAYRDSMNKLKAINSNYEKYSEWKRKNPTKKSSLYMFDLFKAKPSIEVAAIAVINGDKILMGKRKDKGNKWTNPGGHIEKGETPIQGAVRELKEETGVEVKESKLSPMGYKDVTTIDNKKIRVHAFKLNYKGPTTMLDDPDDEVFRWQWLKVKSMPKDVMSNLHAKKNVLLEKLKAKIEKSGFFANLFKAKQRKKVFVKPSRGKKGFWRFQIVGHEDKADTAHHDVSAEDLLAVKSWEKTIKGLKQPYGSVWTSPSGEMYVVIEKDGKDWVAVKGDKFGKKDAEEFVLCPDSEYKHIGEFKEVLEEARRVMFEIEKMGKSGKNHGKGSKTDSIKTVINAFGFLSVPYGHLSDIPYKKQKGDRSNLVGYVAFGKANQDDQARLNAELNVAAQVLTKMKIKMKTPLDFISQKKVAKRRTYGTYYPLATIGRSPMVEIKDTGEAHQKTLMHEIGHAIDYAMKVEQPGKLATLMGTNAAFSGDYKSKKEVAEKFERIKEIVRESPFYQKSTGSYLVYISKPTEMFARAFEVYSYDVMSKMAKNKEIPKEHVESLFPDVLNNSAKAQEDANEAYGKVYAKNKDPEITKKIDTLHKKFDDMREDKGYIGRLGSFIIDFPKAEKMWKDIQKLREVESQTNLKARTEAKKAYDKKYKKLGGATVKDAAKVTKEISKLMSEIINKVGINKSGFIEIDLRG